MSVMEGSAADRKEAVADRAEAPTGEFEAGTTIQEERPKRQSGPTQDTSGWLGPTSLYIEAETEGKRHP